MIEFAKDLMENPNAFHPKIPSLARTGGDPFMQAYELNVSLGG